MALLLIASTGAMGAKKVHTLGDSTMASYDETTETKRGWGMYLGNFLTGGWTSVNYAKGGRDSRRGYDELWQTAKANVAQGDYVIIQFSHNDEKYNGLDNQKLQAYYARIGDSEAAAAVKSNGRGTRPSTTYKECLKQIVDEVKARGATPILVSAVAHCYFSNDKVTRTGRHDLGDNFSVLTENGIMEKQQVPTDDVNLTGSIAYKLDKGGADQGDDTVMTPDGMAAGFAAKRWTAGTALTMNGTTTFKGKTGNTVQTKIYNGTASRRPSSSTHRHTYRCPPKDGTTPWADCRCYGRNSTPPTPTETPLTCRSARPTTTTWTAIQARNMRPSA